MCTWPYLDVKKLATVGVGCLIDPVDSFASLPWTVDGARVSVGVALDWLYHLKSSPAGYVADWYAAATPLRLSTAAVDDLLEERARDAEAVLSARFPDWDDAPASAQLGALSMAWACGAKGVAFDFPHFDAAFLASNWATCAAECHMDDSNNPGLTGRNVANKALFEAAAAGGDPDAIAWVA